jgi:hypothetical protein
MLEAGTNPVLQRYSGESRAAEGFFDRISLLSGKYLYFNPLQAKNRFDVHRLTAWAPKARGFLPAF